MELSSNDGGSESRSYHIAVSIIYTLKIWEMSVESTFKHRLKDSFVQWQEQSGDIRNTYGLRIKDPQKAQEVRYSWNISIVIIKFVLISFLMP